MIRLQRVTFMALHNYLGLSSELVNPVSELVKPVSELVNPVSEFVNPVWSACHDS